MTSANFHNETELNKLFQRYMVEDNKWFCDKIIQWSELDINIIKCFQQILTIINAKDTAKLRSITLASLTSYGVTQEDIETIYEHVWKYDKIKNRKKDPSLSGNNSFSTLDEENYEEDFESLSSPEKQSSDAVSVLDSAFSSPMEKKPPKTMTVQAVTSTDTKPRISPSRNKDKEWIAKGLWTMGEKIGAGSFGEVFKGLNNMHGKIFAVKRMRVTPGKIDDIQNLVNEIDLMRNMSHPNIVCYVGTKVSVNFYEALC
jgi:hypothetical protein